MVFEQPLLHILSAMMECEYISDLKFLSSSQRSVLCEKLKELPLREEDIKDWNDTLEYLTGALPQPTVESAREKLIQFLDSQEELN